jgi:hypothetical protein
MRFRVSTLAGGLVVVLSMALLAVASGPRPATADHEKAQATRGKVTAFLGIEFSTKRCDGDRAYKINAVSRRWHRGRLNRKVKAAFLTRARGHNCSGEHTSIAHDRNRFQPCFGCDGYKKRWTPDYFSQYRWPYVKEIFADNSIGAVLYSQVKTRSGRNIGEPTCLKIVLAGHMDSVFC